MGTDSVIYIRTDGNSTIATGHLVRCLCIAQALESMSKKVCFLVSDDISAALLQDLASSIFPGYTFSIDIQILKTAFYNNMEAELEELQSLITGKSYTDAVANSLSAKPVILIDSYYVTSNYLSSLRTFSYVAYMDDLRVFEYDVDLVINYDVIPDSKTEEYARSYANVPTTLLGAGYTPLRQQFQNKKITPKEDFKNVLITSGGSDPYHFTENLASYLLSQNLGITLHIVVGKLFTNTQELESLASNNPAIRLHYHVSDMAALMKQCDYGISAAGTTLYELCALGIPSISFSMAENQKIMAETFSETGAIPYAGDIQNKTKEEMQVILTNIKEHLLSLSQDSSKRIAQYKLMSKLVDGCGAVKIAEALCKL